MDKIIFIPNGDFDLWKNAVKETALHENWIFTEEDYNHWNEGFGSNNFNFLVAVETNGKKIVGHIAWTFYDSISASETIATAGVLFVSPEYRRTGLGLELTTRTLKDPRGTKYNKAVIGVGTMTKKYAMLGFNKYPDWQYEDMEADTKEINHENLEKNRLVKTISFESVDFKEFVCYDSHITGGIRRDGFIKRFMESKDAFSKVATDCDGKIVGYGNIRVGSNKQLAIGPLYADSGDIAETLLKDILKSINHITQYNKIFYYPSTSNNHAKEIFFKLASNKVRENDKMFVQFSDTIPKISAGKIFSITEYGLGFC